MSSLLRIHEALPDGLLEARPTQLADLLGGPSLIHLPGRRADPLFISVLLHGNETTGFLALQALLKRHRDKELPRALSIFIGNVEAAQDGLRRLAGQPDYNRVWPGGSLQHYAATPALRQCGRAQQYRYQSALRLHQSHRPPLHAPRQYVQSYTGVFHPVGVQSMAFAQLCPALTVECGKVGQSAGEVHAEEFLDACLHLSEIPQHPVAAHDVDLFHTVAIVRVPRAYSFGFGEQPVDICFIDDMDHLNFRELPAGTTLAQLDGVDGMPLEVSDESGQEVADRYFTVEGDMLRTTRALMPSMFTLDERVIRQDCLGYLMERYPLPG
jgi:hypothetical protein